MVDYNSCKVDANGTIEGVKCELGGSLYHRTRPKNLIAISKKGELEPSKETGVISFSCNPDHTFGGRTRLVFDKEDVDKTRPMCYVEGEEERELDKETHKRIENSNKSRNEVHAKIGATPKVYSKECEYMKDEPVSLNKAKKVEYWLGWKPDWYSANVSCEDKHPAYVNISSKKKLNLLRKNIRKSKNGAESIGKDFDVRSCFNVARIKKSWDKIEWAELNKENLDRLEEGKELITQKDKPNLGCRC